MAKKTSPEWRERVSRGVKRGQQRRRERLRARPRDLDRLRSEGLVSPALRPIVSIAEVEAAEIFEGLGGTDRVTPQKRIIIEDLCGVGIALRATLALFLQSNDPELASRIATLAGARRASLVALGLERLEKEIDLKTYLAQRSESAEVAAGEANDSHDDAKVGAGEFGDGDTDAGRAEKSP